MRTTTIEIENLNLRDLLTVDTHGEEISIEDPITENTFKLIPNRYTFFNSIYSNVEKDGLHIIKGDVRESISLTKLLQDFNKRRSSCVVLIEGFAGCGKSTLVQYILWKQLQTCNYDYYFYNYDLEAQNDLIIHDQHNNVIKKSSIFEAIRKSFCEQFIIIAAKKPNVILEFCKLCVKCKEFKSFNDIYYSFSNTDTFREIQEDISEGVTEKNKDIVESKLFKQSKEITSSTCLLALDYILRIAMYKEKVIKKLYICYDNLDAIEDAEDLNSFDDNLNKFRSILDNFISMLKNDDYFLGIPKPHFIMIATYRKITASMADIAETAYKEVQYDKIADSRLNNYVYHIDATTAFSYKKIVAKRKIYFEYYLRNMDHISDKTKNKLKKEFSAWNKLNQNLEIMHNRYASLWNRNYRTCSLIANELFSDPQYEFYECINFVNNSQKKKNKIPIFEYRKMDGYDIAQDSDGNNVLCTYYGGSAILLSSICKVFNNNGIWNDFLNLTSLQNSENSYKYVSLSRLILTYIYNKKTCISLSELFNVFCSKNLFSSEEMCTCLSNMLARNPYGVWRRPIYYYKECILSNKASDIKSVLLKQCDSLKNGIKEIHNYSFLLCDSGNAYVERLMQEFEFFSNRISNKNKSLYLYSDIDMIENNIKEVYNSVKNCCINMTQFMNKYMKVNGITPNEYLSLPIHPTTNRHSPQLHTERTIFSHIAYLNNVRLYYLDNNVTSNIDKRKEYNELFVRYIENYLKLYFDHINPITSKRCHIADSLMKITKNIQYCIESKNDNLTVLFQSISLNSK